MEMDREVYSFDPDSDLQLILTDEQLLESIAPHNAVLGDDDVSSNDTIHTPEDSRSIMEDSNSLTNGAPPRSMPSKEIRMLVSSKIMMLVSPVFKAMLQHSNFKEGVELSKGGVEVPLPDDDPVAWKILLGIMHHDPKQVPREVDLKTMTNIAILVDKYQLSNLLHFHAERWIEHLTRSDPGLPTDLDVDLVPWLCISWVFGLYSEFTDMTRIAMRQSSGSAWNDQNLPIPDLIFGKKSTLSTISPGGQKISTSSECATSSGTLKMRSN